MTRLLASTALCASLATPALADLTVQEAWGIWKAQFRAYGVTLDASETPEGEALQIGEMRLSFALPEGIGEVYTTFPGPRFAPGDGGTVTVTFPEVMDITLGGEVQDEGAAQVTLQMRGTSQPGVMDGTAQEATTTWAGTGMTGALTGLSVEGEEVPDVTATVTLLPYELRNTTRLNGATVEMTQSARYDGYDVAYGVVLPEAAGGTMDMNGAATGMRVESRSVLPSSGLDLMDLHTQLRGGLSLASRVTAESTRSAQKVIAGGEVIMDQATSAEAYDISMQLDRAGLDYSGTAGAFQADVQDPTIPIPLRFGGEAVDFRVKLPLLKSELAQDVIMRMGLKGLSVQEDLWAMFDPEARLPRDSADIVIDMSGRTTLMMDLVDFPSMIAGDIPDLPATAERATLNELVIAALGARLTGAGDFTLDMDDLESFDGLPRPEGSASFTATGVNALIDTLVEMGLMSDDDVTGFRMMAAMFTRPGEGNDTLLSEIVINAEGQVLINGQRIK
ncbi:DUF2125 domain-containing protein [Marimonas lutisalis]|uniref:DUF2125 domain-containing protein n=1 Tax=Marimonas lutisalis TaxID=2545756 RepID=UPI0010F6AA73|nr:DUF2125 domain-containing protein [Marimonas lutisalis]